MLQLSIKEVRYSLLKFWLHCGLYWVLWQNSEHNAARVGNTRVSGFFPTICSKSFAWSRIGLNKRPARQAAYGRLELVIGRVL